MFKVIGILFILKFYLFTKIICIWKRQLYLEEAHFDAYI